MSRVLPILFNTDMVRAILDGRKTVTRRICKDANELTVPDMSFYDADKRTYAVHNYANKEHTDKLSIAERTCLICPGDFMYVRETWGTYNRNWWEADYFMYRADYPDGATSYTHNDGIICDLPKWRPSIHMPKEAARIWLKVKDVRVERLQDITPEDALNEGAQITSFVSIWNSTLKKSDLDRYGWDTNPWVWEIEFERCAEPEGGRV